MSLTSAESRALYQRILEEQPDRVDVLDSLAQVEFRSGNPSAAAELLRRAIRLSPQSVHLYTNLAVTLAVQKQFDESISLFRQALALKPNAPEILLNLAAMLRDQGAMKEAAEIYKQLIAIQPANADTHYDLGGALKDAGNLEGAIQAYQQATTLRPGFVQAHNDLANCLYLTGRFDQAITHYQKTLALRSDYAEGYNNLCISLHAVGHLDEAAAAARQALSLRPQFPEALYNLGRVLQDQQRFDEAIDVYERALKLRPNYVEARNNLAGSLERIGRLEEAIAQYRQTVADRPDYREAWGNLGVALKNCGRVDEAIETYQQILAAASDDHVARWNLGIALLLKGDFEHGWQAYEARRKIPTIASIRKFPQPQWQGEALEGRRILLHAEQGFGDAIQFIRYAPLVRQRGGRVLVLCHPALRRLFDNQVGIEHVIADGEPLSAFDLHCPLLSLPGIFGSSLTTLPADVPYLAVGPQLVQKWRERLPTLSVKFNIGIAWAGSATHARDRERSLTLAALAPLAQVPGVRFFSLQKTDSPQEAKSPPSGMELIDFTTELGDFAETAALVANLDLLICADTAVAHLAGALGKPVWVLLPFAPDWRWMLNRSDSPWFPTMRLFRQPRWGDWVAPIGQIAQELNVIANPRAAETQNDLANQLYLGRRYDEAANSYKRALALRPDFPEGYNNLSICCYELGRMDETIAAARRAISLRANYPEAHNNYANALQRKGMLSEAIDEYRKVLAIRPDDLPAMTNLGVALESTGRLDEAIVVFEKLLASKQDDPVTRFNLAIALLRSGDLERGWPAYEARRKIRKGLQIRAFAQPRWTGEPLDGKRILLHAEQGFGDAIQFIRYAPMVRQRGGCVLVLCPPALRRLFIGQLGIGQVISDQEPLPDFDLHCPLLSLPGAFQTSLETIPMEVPYLAADPQLEIKWRDKLQSNDGRMKVGIAWAGRETYERDAERSLTLRAFGPLARVSGVAYYKLQKGPQAKQTPPPGLELIDLTDELSDFAETAALISNLDLIISADTATAHLAGALAKPVWVLLPFLSDWRWMMDRIDSPWYPTMRLFRQPRWGAWDGPIEQVASLLEV